MSIWTTGDDAHDRRTSHLTCVTYGNITEFNGQIKLDILKNKTDFLGDVGEGMEGGGHFLSISLNPKSNHYRSILISQAARIYYNNGYLGKCHRI